MQKEAQTVLFEAFGTGNSDSGFRLMGRLNTDGAVLCEKIVGALRSGCDVIGLGPDRISFCVSGASCDFRIDEDSATAIKKMLKYGSVQMEMVEDSNYQGFVMTGN